MHIRHILPAIFLSAAAVFDGIAANGAPPAGHSGSAIRYVAADGDDATAIPGKLDKPFATITGAKANATNALIYLQPAHYANHSSLAAQKINYFMLPGVTIDYVGKEFTNILDDTFFPNGIRVNIDGFADIANHSSYFDGSKYPGLIQITNPLTRLDLRCRDMLLRDTDLGSINILNCSYVNIDAQNMYGGDNSTGVYWRDGSGIHIKAKEIRTGAYALWEDSSAGTNVQDMFADVDYIETDDEGGLYVSGHNPNSALWVKSKVIKFNSITGVHHTGLSKFYASAQKYWITRTNGALFYIANNGKFWCDGNKATSAGAPFLLTTQGFVDLTIQQYEESGGAVEVGFDLGGGTVYIHGGRMDIRGSCVRNVGGTNNLANMILDSSRSTKSPVVVEGAGLTLQNCRLIAAPGVESIAANTPQTVRIVGTLTANTKPSTNITFIGGQLDIQ